LRSGVLKAWVDQIVRIHRTFASTPGGKVGKLRDRPAWLVVASAVGFPGPARLAPRPSRIF